MRAAAAEARLAMLASPKTGVKSDGGNSDSDDHQPLDDLDDVKDDVDDPHLDPKRRKKEMEDEMDEDEKCELRGGWEEFLGGGTKRSRTPERDEDVSTRRKLGPAMSRPVKREASEEPAAGKVELGTSGLGDVDDVDVKPMMSATATYDAQKKEISSKTGSRRWACKVCTYKNLTDHGRCGELPRA
jgi:hypothetical protein